MRRHSGCRTDEQVRLNICITYPSTYERNMKCGCSPSAPSGFVVHEGLARQLPGWFGCRDMLRNQSMILARESEAGRSPAHLVLLLTRTQALAFDRILACIYHDQQLPGPCSNTQPGSGMGVMDKLRIATSCNAPWPCADGVHSRMYASVSTRALVVADKCKSGRDYEKCPIGMCCLIVPVRGIDCFFKMF